MMAVAAALWGDASLWYIIASANGLYGPDSLAAGMSLTSGTRGEVVPGPVSHDGRQHRRHGSVRRRIHPMSNARFPTSLARSSPQL